HFAKGYQAWVLGAPSPDAGMVDAPIARQAPDSFTRVVSPDGQRAVSRYRTLRTAALPGGQTASLLALSPVTGRTHQLRVHMAHIGCPLLGDTRYGTAASQGVSVQLGLAHHQLSAVSLRFVHPITGRQLELTHAPVFDFDPGDA
ncbi:MAG: RluA family pseudouridine synthase, partial [Candidatus Ventricola sp.]